MEIPTVTVDDLRQFHAKHFADAPIPSDFVYTAEAELTAHDGSYEFEDDGLGYYEDGVKRTLTDEQIALFRHTEIQTILRERMRKRDASPESEQALSDMEGIPSKIQSGRTLEAVNVTTTPSLSQPHGPLKKVEDGRIEKKGQWVAISQKTKDKNRRKNNRHKKNKQLQKREERKRDRGVETFSRDNDDDESDEWDPWRQATGPDVQKDTTVDLDY